MPYKLLIEYEFSFESPLKQFLKPNEVIRNEPVELSFSIANVGTDRFPGGQVRDFRVRYGPSQQIESALTKNVDCLPIAPGEKVSLSPQTIVPLTEGLSFIYMSIEPEGEDKGVEYYQGPDDVLAGREWTDGFYVVYRELLALVSLMSR